MIFAAHLGNDASPTLFTPLAGRKYFLQNFWADFWPMFYVWFPADLLCFSAPVWLRMPICHAVSLGWTMYVSLIRGGEATQSQAQAVEG